MSEQRVTSSETTLGYEIFGPLWGLVFVGAVGAATTVAEYARQRRADLDRLTGTVREIGDFSAGTMAILEEQAPWRSASEFADGEVLAANLVMYAGFLEPLPVDLTDPVVRRRLVRMGIDCQLTHLTHALVLAGAERGRSAEAAAPLIAAGLNSAASLAGAGAGDEPLIAYRSWRVVYLAALLRPDSAATGEAKERLRGYARTLDRLLVPDDPAS